MRHLKSFRVFENQTLNEKDKDAMVQQHLDLTAANLAKEAGVSLSAIKASPNSEPTIDPKASEALGEAALKKLKAMFKGNPEGFKKLISELEGQGVKIPAELLESYGSRVYEANYGTVETEMSEADAKEAASAAISRHGLKAFLFGFTGLITALTGASGYMVSDGASDYSLNNAGETNWSDYPVMKPILITAGVGLMIAAVVNAYKASTKQSAFNKKFGSK